MRIFLLMIVFMVAAFVVAGRLFSENLPELAEDTIFYDHNGALEVSPQTRRKFVQLFNSRRKGWGPLLHTEIVGRSGQFGFDFPNNGTAYLRYTYTQSSDGDCIVYLRISSAENRGSFAGGFDATACRLFESISRKP